MENQTKETRKAIDTLLSESFKELAVKKPIEKITIKEITGSAGVIRPTFYNHFRDKYELMEWIVREELMQPMLSIMKSGQYYEGVVFVLSKIEDEKAFYQSAARLEGQNSFEESITDAISEILQEYTDEDNLKKIVDYPWATKAFVSNAYAQFIGHLLIGWIHAGMAIPKEELVDAIVRMMNHPSADLLIGK